MKIIHEIGLDLVTQTEVPRIRVKQGDVYTRQVALHLTAGGENWTVPADASVVIRYRVCDPEGGGMVQGIYDTLPDGTAAWEISDNTVTITLVPQMTAAHGTVQADVAFIQGEKILATCNFEIYVNQSPATGAEAEAQSYYNVVTLAQINEQFQDLIYKFEFLMQEKLNNTGGEMTGDLCMLGNRVTQLGIPQADDDAARKDYVDEGILWLQTELAARLDDSGLGEAKSVTVSGMDAVTSTGWYRISGDMTIDGESFSRAYMRVDAYDSDNCLQTLYPVNQGMGILQRFCWEGTWQDWEWENPPMVVGNEYRTTKRWENRPVYVKKVSFGKLPNTGGAAVSTGCAGADFFSLEGTGYLSSGSAISLSMWAGVRAGITADGILKVTTESDLSSYSAYFVIQYTKS